MRGLIIASAVLTALKESTNLWNILRSFIEMNTRILKALITVVRNFVHNTVDMSTFFIILLMYEILVI